MPVKLNKVFIVNKGNIVARWKVIIHPYFPDTYALVGDYCDLYGPMVSGSYERDIPHICGVTSLETAYADAYKLT